MADFKECRETAEKAARHARDWVEANKDTPALDPAALLDADSMHYAAHLSAKDVLDARD